MLLKQEIIILHKTIPAETAAIGMLTILYVAGIVGIATSVHSAFILLTPIHLLFSLAIMLAFHPDWNRRIAFYLVLSYIVGFGAEVYGVQTGQLFGSYVYGWVLGPKLWDTPLLIGFNWMLLSYSIGVTVNHWLSSWYWLLKGIVAALLMVGLDILIEPVAIRYDFWTWANGAPPLQNYIGWFLVSLPLLCIFAFTQTEVKNKVAVALFLLQILFFAILNFG